MNARSSRFARWPARWLFAAALTIPGIVLAQSWPNKPVRLVVPFVAGGSADAVARTIAQKVGQNTGQQFVVDNRPGAGGAMGSGEVVRAAPDGYTLLFTTSSTHAIAPNLVAKLPYNTVGDFTAIAHLANAPLVLLVAPNVEAKTVPELIELARKQPGCERPQARGAGAGAPFRDHAMIEPAGNGAPLHRCRGHPCSLPATGGVCGRFSRRVQTWMAAAISALCVA